MRLYGANYGGSMKLNKYLAALFAALSLFVSCGHTSDKGKQSSEEKKFYNLLDEHWAKVMKMHPEFATWTNFKDGLYNGKWSDYSLEGIEKSNEATKESLREIIAIDKEELSAKAQLDYDLYRNSLEHRVEGFEFPSELFAIDQLGGFHLDIPQLLSRMPKRKKKDYDNILERFEKVPDIIEQKLALLKMGLEKGITPPKVTLRDIPNQFDSILVSDMDKNPMTKAFTSFPKSFSEEEKAEYRKKAKVFLSKAIKAFAKAKKYVTDVYIPNCRETIALTDLPNGDKWYQYEVKGYITTDQTADEIHKIGLSEVKRIKKEMDKVIKKLKFKGSFNDFLKDLRTNPKFFFKNKNDLLVRYRDIAKRADFKLFEVFNTLPRTPYGVEPTPAYMEKSAPTAYYYGGSTSAGRPGTFFANTYDLKSRPTWEMVALTLHEAVPGHHLQISINEELGDVPEFRKRAHYTAYVEGWGLYAESLGEEMGMYEDLYDKFGQLTYEMWRAIRLVVDTGMHSKKWSRERAIEYFKNHAPKTEHDIVVEIDRYIIWPGQALSYKIGELKFKELREKAKQKLGDKFDLREYHNQALKHGALPLNILEDKIDQWIEASL